MSSYLYIQRFERIIKQLFESKNYQTEITRGASDQGYDLVVRTDEIRIFVEIKFYRSRAITPSLLKATANQLAFAIKNERGAAGLVIVNTVITQKLKQEIVEAFGIEVWDRHVISSELATLSSELEHEFSKLLIDAQQGTATYQNLVGEDAQRALGIPPLPTVGQFNIKVEHIPFNKGQKLVEELEAIPCGRAGWSRYETKCLEILQFLFSEDLTLWEKQNNTEDDLSRFDLICRVTSADDYWNAIISSFNSRFILFEFKNYCEGIEQGQIYTTERYLYNKALRSVGFIIARNGAKPNAISAAKGALKEHGKLILILSNQDLANMLALKDKNESANDYLSNMLDKWLITLSR